MEKFEGTKGGMKMEKYERDRDEENEREGNEGFDFFVEMHRLRKETNL